MVPDGLCNAEVAEQGSIIRRDDDVVLKEGIEDAALEVREGADLRSSVGADSVTVTALRHMTAIPDENDTCA